MTVTPAVSADRRYVRLSVNPYFNAVNGFSTFTTPLGAVGGGGSRWRRPGRSGRWARRRWRQSGGGGVRRSAAWARRRNFNAGMNGVIGRPGFDGGMRLAGSSTVGIGERRGPCVRWRWSARHSVCRATVRRRPGMATQARDRLGRPAVDQSRRPTRSSRRVHA